MNGLCKITLGTDGIEVEGYYKITIIPSKNEEVFVKTNGFEAQSILICEGVTIDGKDVITKVFK